MTADLDDYDDERNDLEDDVDRCIDCGYELLPGEGTSPDDMEYGRCNDCIPGGAYFY